MKRKNVVPMVALLIVLSIFPLFGLQAGPIVLGKAITWVHAGDKWDPSQMALVRAEFDEEISYGSKAGLTQIGLKSNIFQQKMPRSESISVI